MTKILFHVAPSKIESIAVPAVVGSIPSSRQLQLTISGNNTYKKLVGIMLLIANSDGTPYTKKALISVSSTAGQLIIPELPYACIRPSFNETPNERIYPVDNNISGSEADIRFQVTLTNSEATEKTFEVTAVCFYTNR